MEIELSLIVPAFNEKDNIEAFVKKVEEDLSEYTTRDALEIVMIDDGSKDGTYEEMARVSSQSSIPIRLIQLSRNFGKESAVYAGLEHSTGEYTCIIDADLQQPPYLVAQMMNELVSDSDYDCVAAYQEKRQDSLIKNKLSSAFYWLLKSSSRMEVIADASDFRVFRKEVKESLLRMEEGYRFSKGLFAWVGFKTKPFPYTPDPRAAGETSWSIVSLAKYAIDGVVSFSISPLRIATFAGFLSSLAAVIYLIFTVVQVCLFGISVPGYASIVVLILLFSGTQLLTLGILGEYLGRLYIENKRRPIYIARLIEENNAQRSNNE